MTLMRTDTHKLSDIFKKKRHVRTQKENPGICWNPGASACVSTFGGYNLRDRRLCASVPCRAAQLGKLYFFFPDLGLAAVSSCFALRVSLAFAGTWEGARGFLGLRLFGVSAGSSCPS